MIWAKRLFRLIAVLLVFLAARYFLMRFLEPYHFHFDHKPSLEWMEDHPDLSGWAQFAGATAAIVLAIMVPAWQRHGQNLDRWRDAQSVNASLALLSYYLLGEVRNYLNGYLGSESMPRMHSRKDIETADLLQRIQALENRENNQNRITRLFRARGMILQTTTAMTSPFSQNEPLSNGEAELLRERIANLMELITEAEKANHDAIDALSRANLWMPSRFMYSIIIFIIRGRIV